MDQAGIGVIVIRRNLSGPRSDLEMANSSSGDSVTARVIRVLETFGPNRTSQTVSEIARRAKLPKSTAHRLVSDLVAAQLLHRADDRSVSVGLRLWELASRSSPALQLGEIALPFMEQVQKRLGEHTQLVVVEDDKALCVERLSAPGSGENLTRIAGRLPLHACSSGLILLAFGDGELRSRVLDAPLERMAPETITDPQQLSRLLRKIRGEGYAVAPGYVSAVSTGVAVPILDGLGGASAALSVVLPRDAAPEPAILELQSAARRIAHAAVRLG
ncbi:MAG TPA: IclR family transcriptional regulator [Solirubrobacteraceae bacterium]|nr:IclR family transcriptional regulator [Solirubrobacteraceae bacterium]